MVWLTFPSKLGPLTILPHYCVDIYPNNSGYHIATPLRTALMHIEGVFTCEMDIPMEKGTVCFYDPLENKNLYAVPYPNDLMMSWSAHRRRRLAFHVSPGNDTVHVTFNPKEQWALDAFVNTYERPLVTVLKIASRFRKMATQRYMEELKAPSPLFKTFAELKGTFKTPCGETTLCGWYRIHHYAGGSLDNLWYCYDGLTKQTIVIQPTTKVPTMTFDQVVSNFSKNVAVKRIVNKNLDTILDRLYRPPNGKMVLRLWHQIQDLMDDVSRIV